MKHILALLTVRFFLSACQTVPTPNPKAKNQPSIADFGATPGRGTTPLQVSFDAGASSDSEGSIASDVWKFGDGATGNGATTTHTFTNPGDYTMTLTVTDGGGLSDNAQQTIRAEPNISPNPNGDEARVIGTSYQIAEGLPQRIKERLNESATAAVIATGLSGSSTLVTTGTLTEFAPLGGTTPLANAFAYQPTPADHLRVILLDGKEYDISYNALQGDFSANGTQFANGDHETSLELSSNESACAYASKLDAVRFNGTIQASLMGDFTDKNGTCWEVDLTVQGHYNYIPDGPELQESLAYRGTMTTKNLTMTIDKDYHFYSLASLIDSSNLADFRQRRWNFSNYCGCQRRVVIGYNIDDFGSNTITLHTYIYSKSELEHIKMSNYLKNGSRLTNAILFIKLWNIYL